jgi:hypothetical protein
VVLLKIQSSGMLFLIDWYLLVGTSEAVENNVSAFTDEPLAWISYYLGRGLCGVGVHPVSKTFAARFSEYS